MPWDWLADPELSAAGALDDCEADAELSAADALDDCEADADCVELLEDADEAPLLAHPPSAQSAAHTNIARILFMISSPSTRLPFTGRGSLATFEIRGWLSKEAVLQSLYACPG